MRPDQRHQSYPDDRRLLPEYPHRQTQWNRQPVPPGASRHQARTKDTDGRNQLRTTREVHRRLDRHRMQEQHPSRDHRRRPAQTQPPTERPGEHAHQVMQPHAQGVRGAWIRKPQPRGQAPRAEPERPRPVLDGPSILVDEAVLGDPRVRDPQPAGQHRQQPGCATHSVRRQRFAEPRA